MPVRPNKPCAQPGCGALVPPADRFCPNHLRAERKRFDATRPSGSARGYDARWQAIRNQYIAEHLLCVKCEARGLVVAAAEVDHIIPLARGGTSEDSNLQSLCKPCHSSKTAREVGFGGAR